MKDCKAVILSHAFVKLCTNLLPHREAAKAKSELDGDILLICDGIFSETLNGRNVFISMY